MNSLQIRDNNLKKYEISATHPGYVVIFNQKYFRNKPEQTRNGSEKDVERLDHLFNQLNYTVEAQIDRTSSQIRSLIRDYSNQDYSKYSSFFMFIMSHGSDGTISTTDNTQVYLTEFFEPFKTNRTLKNKPKLFFIQACRGHQRMTQVEHDAYNTDYETDAIIKRVPIEADFLFAYSTVEGYVAYRDPNKGSWYIQTLCDLISSSVSNDEILHILTDVNSSLADREEVVVPTFNSRLTKRFYFIQQSSSNENIISKAKEYFKKGLNATDLYQKIEFYSKSIELNPNDSNAYNNKGNTLKNLGRNEEAIECYNKSIELNPNDSLAYYNKGTTLMNLGRNEEAIKCYNKSIELNPNYSDAYYNKGTTLKNLGRSEEAIECYNKSIELNPNDSDAYNSKGNALGNLGRNEEAIKCYNKSIELNPNDSNALENRNILLRIFKKNGLF